MDKGFDDLNSFLKNSYEKNKLKRKKKNKYLIILVNIITIITLIGAGIGIKSINDYKDEIKKTSEYEKSLLNRKPILIEKEEIKKDLYDFTELLKTNPDITLLPRLT